jgi:hydrogenase maturation protease
VTPYRSPQRLNLSIEDVLLGAIPGLPKVHLHNPVLAYEHGSDFLNFWHLAAAGKLEPNDLVILVDACQRGGEPGTIYLIGADVIPTDEPPSRLEGHSMSPASVLRMVHSMGGAPGRILIVGCEPTDLGLDEEGKLGLSDIVMAAVDQAVAMVQMQVAKALAVTAVAAR